MTTTTTTMRSTKRQGQGMTEYVLLVGMVAILMVGAVKGLGSSVGKAFEATTSGLDKVTEMVNSGGDDAAPSTRRPGNAGLIGEEEGEGEPTDDLSLPGRLPR
jgi:Flp pilus assembly pilin Flp